MELDPEKRLWLPSRRSFFFLGAAAGVGALLPEVTPRMTATEALMPLCQDRFRSRLVPIEITEVWDMVTGDVHAYRTDTLETLRRWNFKTTFAHGQAPFVILKPDGTTDTPARVAASLRE